MTINTKEYKIHCYKIYWDDNKINDEFVGSTKQPRLSSRITAYRYNAKNNKKGKIYDAIRKNGKNFKYVLLKSYMVESTDEKRKWERYWENNIPQIDNKYKIEDSIDYRICGCGEKIVNSKIILDNKSHYKSTRHQLFCSEISRRTIKTYTTRPPKPILSTGKPTDLNLL